MRARFDKADCCLVSGAASTLGCTISLRRILADLAPFQEATLAQVEAEHYKLERIFELLGMASGDILHHLLAERGITPTSYRKLLG